ACSGQVVQFFRWSRQIMVSPPPGPEAHPTPTPGLDAARFVHPVKHGTDRPGPLIGFSDLNHRLQRVWFHYGVIVEQPDKNGVLCKGMTDSKITPSRKTKITSSLKDWDIRESCQYSVNRIVR